MATLAASGQAGNEARQRRQIALSLRSETLSSMENLDRERAIPVIVIAASEVCQDFCVNDRVLLLGMGCRGRGQFPRPLPIFVED